MRTFVRGFAPTLGRTLVRTLARTLGRTFVRTLARTLVRTLVRRFAPSCTKCRRPKQWEICGKMGNFTRD